MLFAIKQMTLMRKAQKVFGNGNLSGDRNFLTVAVTANMPFGNMKAKKELQKAKINNQNLTYQLAQLKKKCSTRVR